MAIKAVIFDIDGTLSPTISWDYLTMRIGGSLEENAAAFADWSTERITESVLRQRLIANWTRRAPPLKVTFRSILEEIALHDDAPAAVAYLRNKGYRIAAITGSFDIYADIVGEKLGIADRYALTTLIWDAAGRLTDIETNYDGRAQKYIRFMAFCERYGLAPAECVAVGDSSNDMELFRVTKRGIAVQTELEAKELEAIAWKKIRRLKELTAIL
ncbi:HAD family hydrolase [Candidatus Parcubacteria bacterium]|nr:MAG: HAD family hydrolase [Candidatus Parcubacteria bacterium]